MYSVLCFFLKSDMRRTIYLTTQLYGLYKSVFLLDKIILHQYRHYCSGWPDDYLTKYGALPSDMHDRSAENELDHAQVDLDDATKLFLVLMKRMEITTYSTAFSGVDSPGTSFAMLRVALQVSIGDINIKEPEHITGVVTRHYLDIIISVMICLLIQPTNWQYICTHHHH